MMTKEGQVKETTKTPNAALAMIATMADTSWRMFVPIIGLLLLGLFLDSRIHTTPWLMLLGLLCGIALTALLIADQLKRNARG